MHLASFLQVVEGVYRVDQHLGLFRSVLHIAMVSRRLISVFLSEIVCLLYHTFY